MGGDANVGRTASAPQVRGRYRIEHELGRGGLGAVFLAHEIASGRSVALKTLEVVDERTTLLFEREYHVLASLRHPSVIEVYDFGFTDDGRRYYTMEVLPGDDLATIAPLPWRTACVHVRDIAASLSLLHCRRLLHRDVSPRNIRLDAEGRAKLLDFGALTSFGVPSELAGTPVCVAPEAVRRGDLDQRSDLFSLGVVFYMALTGRRPFAVKTLRDIEGATRLRPPAPSTLAEGVPPALDQLIASMLNAEPAGRPTSAAEVFERVCAIAGIDDEAGAEVAESHLVSTALCGRERKKQQLKQHLDHARRGQGGVVVVEGMSGMGKSQLASEALLDARLLGIQALRIDATAHSEPMGVMRALSRLLIEQVPAAVETLGTHHGALLGAFPELRSTLGSRTPRGAPVQLASSAASGVERTAQVQNELVTWTLSIAERSPLLIVIDDAHAADPASLGTLSALAHRARENQLLLLVTQLSGAPASLQMQQLARLGARVKLRAVTAKAIAELVESAFGQAPNAARLAQWLYSVAQGNPGQSVELLTQLLRRRSIRYAGGAWALPAVLDTADLPTSREHALQQRIAVLDPTALRLARLPAIHRGPLTTAVCARALRDVPRDQFFDALDALCSEQLIALSGHSCRIADESLRTKLLAGLPAEAVRQLHCSLGEALAIDSERELDYASLSTEALLNALQAGFHFVHGGEERRGRELLTHGGIELTHRGEGLSAAIPALERAVEAYVEQGRHEYDRASLFVPLTLAGTYVDFRLTYKYGDALMETLAEVTGVELASRLRRVLGRPIALAIGLSVAALRYPFTDRRHTARSFGEALLGLISMGSAIVGACTSLLDAPLARRTVALLEPLCVVPRALPVRTAYEFQLALLDCTEGNFAASVARCNEVLERLRRKSKLLPETARLQLEFGVYIVLGALDAYRTDGSVHATLTRIDAFRTSISLQTAAGVRATYHAFRGERMLFERHRREVDVLAAQLGSTWRQDVLLARNLWFSYALCEDVMGLKQCLRALEAFALDAPSLGAARDATAALYMASRGQAHEALAKYGPALEAASSSINELTIRYVATLASLERACGRAERAEERCRRALEALRPEQLAFEVAVFGARIEQILSLSELGRHTEAMDLVRSMLEAQEQHDNPLLRGLTHKAAARIALRARDADELAHQLERMREWFDRSENPSLIAQYHVLADESVRDGVLRGVRGPTSDAPRVLPPAVSAVRELFSRCRGQADRVQTALEIVLTSSRAERGYLYLADEAGLRFVAPQVGAEPSDALRDELYTQLQALSADADETVCERAGRPRGLATVVEVDDVTDGPVPQGIAGEAYQAIFLLVPRDDELIAVGAAALIRGTHPLSSVDRGVVDEIARALYEAADAHTVYVGQPATATT